MFQRFDFLVIILWIFHCGVKGLDEDRIILELKDEDVRRPIWNVAHMVNALYQVELFVNEGANGVEFDVSFDWEGTAKHTFHGYPCDCFRACTKYADIIEYIENLRNFTTPDHPKYREKLVLLLADMKLSGLSAAARQAAGIDFADKFIKYYWQGDKHTGKAYLLLSIPSIEYSNFLSAFYHELGKQGFLKYKDMIGVEFSGNEDLMLTERVLQSLNIEDHIWQGDGITNCLPRNTVRLREALEKRDRPGKTYIDKVYWWTLDKKSTMRTVLNLGVDGIITNHPHTFVDVLQESEFSGHFRMATIDDSPWVKYKPPTAALYDDTYVIGRGGNINESDIIPDEEELLFNC